MKNKKLNNHSNKNLKKEDSIILIEVKTNAKDNNIEYKNNKYYVNIKEKPIDNKANIAIIKLFKSRLNKKIKIIGGLKSKTKKIKFLE